MPPKKADSGEKPKKKGACPFPSQLIAPIPTHTPPSPSTTLDTAHAKFYLFLLSTAKSGGGGKKISAYNKYVQQELARLKADDPDMPHTERYVLSSSLRSRITLSLMRFAFRDIQLQARCAELENGQGEPKGSGIITR
jgi:hypothetical protein